MARAFFVATQSTHQFVFHRIGVISRIQRFAFLILTLIIRTMARMTPAEPREGSIHNHQVHTYGLAGTPTTAVPALFVRQ